MKKNTSIRKVAKASLVFLISASPVVNAMEKDNKLEERQVASEQLRDHNYYKAELQKLEESTRRIHEEVDRILNEFRHNMEAYYLRTRGTSGVATTLDILQNIQDSSSLSSNPISFEEANIEDKFSSHGTGNKAEIVVNDNSNIPHSSPSNGEEDSDISRTSNPIADAEKDESKKLLGPESSTRSVGTVEMVENALEAGKEGAEAVVGQRVLTAEDLKEIQGFEELGWNSPNVVKAVNYCCKLFKITEIGEGRTESIIRKFDLIHILQNLEQDEPTEKDISMLYTYLHYLEGYYLEGIGLSKLPAVQSALAQYISYNKQQDNDDSFGILIITEFKDARPWWQPGKKVVPETASFSYPKKDKKKSIYSDAIKQDNVEGYDDIKEYMNGNKIKFSEDLLTNKNITKVIIFDDVKKINDKIFVKGHHVYTWDSTFNKIELPTT